MIKVNGVPTLSRYLLSLAPKIKAELRQTTADTAVAMRDDARDRAPVETGELRSSIRFELTNGGLGFFLIADADHWPYIEFGTGGSVDIPAGFGDLAARFKGKGLKTVNLPARPFLIPAYLVHRQRYLDEIKRLLPRILR
ncbi:phage protein, HK97 GP10 family [Fibrella aestuarina BUZ 2]|uniref:Phage protein, HK97 GP10 family n=1 Tax=Fibrella aestuarina BUZ 2 TaxID=1166018 RepID=I0KCY6_9BACT|nr:HK97-gp10 family putative phage morphogenesis protein [Fibrella aestuarina]CCH01989.1 phage protein, HK97 GP10 family [Fibrella aestuarina BUZ 2]